MILNGISSQFETKRLRLRPMLATDVDALQLIFTDAKVMAASDHPPFTRAQMSRWLKRNLDHPLSSVMDCSSHSQRDRRTHRRLRAGTNERHGRG